MRTQTIPVVDDVDLAELEVDPYPTYARLRQMEAPIVYLPAIDEWLVTRWDDCSRMAEVAPVQGNNPADDEFFGEGNVLRIEGPEHTSMRAGIDARLKPRVVNKYIEAASRSVVVDYVERIRQQGAADLAADLFQRISVRVVGNVLGLNDIDDDVLIRWYHTLAGGRANETGDPNADARAAAAIAEIDNYLEGRVDRLGIEPDDSILSHMVHTGAPEGEPRTYAQLSPTINVIILGGFQEPGNAMAAAFHGLLNDPEQMRAVHEDPAGLAAPGVQESLRWIAPIQQVTRQAKADIDYDGYLIPDGALIQLIVASANRDEARFERPDEYDVFRMLKPNATFGYGHHFCAGHHLSRGLAQITIEETARRLPNLRRDPDREASVRGYLFRGVQSLPVLWDA